MNYTDNYHLPQWEKSDRILMEDFNQAMSDIESGLAENAQTIVETAAAAAADAQQAATAAKAAQSAASRAQTTANNAYSASNKPYVVGTYMGAGGNAGQTIKLGFTPSFVIVGGDRNNAQNYSGQCAAAGKGMSSRFIECVTNGFKVTGDSLSYMQLNDSGITYAYIAFR